VQGGLRQAVLQVAQVFFEKDGVAGAPQQQRGHVQTADRLGDPVQCRPAGMACGERDVGHELTLRQALSQ